MIVEWPHEAERSEADTDKSADTSSVGAQNRVEQLLDEEGVAESAPRIATGIFAPDPEEQLEAFRSVKRNRDAQIDVSRELDDVNKEHQEVEKLIEKEKEKEGALANMRGGLGVPHADGETLKKLEAKKEELREEKSELELAGQYNDVLGSFSSLSETEREYIEEHGERRDKSAIQDSNGKKIDSEVAKRLAGFYNKGGRRMTWGKLDDLRPVADRILKDVRDAAKDVAKSLFGADAGSKGEAPPSQKGTEQSFA